MNAATIVSCLGTTYLIENLVYECAEFNLKHIIPEGEHFFLEIQSKLHCIEFSDT